jgi:hypothetical protein
MVTNPPAPAAVPRGHSHQPPNPRLGGSRLRALSGDRGRCPPACAHAAVAYRRRRAPLACRPGLGPCTPDSPPDVKAATIQELAGHAVARTSRGQHPTLARDAVSGRTAPARTAQYAAPARNGPRRAAAAAVPTRLATRDVPLDSVRTLGLGVPVCPVHETASPACRRTADTLRNPDSSLFLTSTGSHISVAPAIPGRGARSHPSPPGITGERLLQPRRSSRALAANAGSAQAGDPRAMCGRYLPGTFRGHGWRNRRPAANLPLLAAVSALVAQPGPGRLPSQPGSRRLPR